MIQVLFVCLGNICRSPSAEAVFNALIEKNKLDGMVSCDSAGLTGYHVGEPADYRMKQFARKRGYHLTSISRLVNSRTDFSRFDYIIGMDNQNVRELKSMASTELERNKIFLMTDFCSDKRYTSVPDPYYGGDAGFEMVLDILEDACEGLIREICEK